MTSTQECDRTIWNTGKSVLFTSGNATQNEMEQWVQQLASTSGQPVDWGIIGGRDVVRTTGDIQQVVYVAIKLLPMLEQTLQLRNSKLDYLWCNDNIKN